MMPVAKERFEKVVAESEGTMARVTAVTRSGGPPGGRSLSKDGTRADSAKDFCCV